MASIRYLKLTQNKQAIVDSDVYEWVSQWKWTYDSTNGYAYRREHLPSTRKDQKSKKIYLHRLINKTPDGMLTDHLNRDKLDNRKINLRTVNRSQSQSNRGLHSNNKSGYFGVSWSERDKVWTAELSFNKKRILRKSFKKLDDAIKARQRAEEKLH